MIRNTKIYAIQEGNGGSKVQEGALSPDSEGVSLNFLFIHSGVNWEISNNKIKPFSTSNIFSPHSNFNSFSNGQVAIFQISYQMRALKFANFA